MRPPPACRKSSLVDSTSTACSASSGSRKAFDTAADVVVTGLVEQARRSSFNFDRKEARVEAGFRLSRVYSAIGLYSFQHTRLFDERYTPEEAPPLIDRLFPQVRLSKVSGLAHPRQA